MELFSNITKINNDNIPEEIKNSKKPEKDLEDIKSDM